MGIVPARFRLPGLHAHYMSRQAPQTEYGNFYRLVSSIRDRIRTPAGVCARLRCSRCTPEHRPGMVYGAKEIGASVIGPPKKMWRLSN